MSTSFENRKNEPVEQSADLEPSGKVDRWAYPHFDKNGIYHPGLSKAELAVIHFVGAHFHAQGRYPDSHQLIVIIELAQKLFVELIPSVVGDQVAGLEQKSAE